MASWSGDSDSGIDDMYDYYNVNKPYAFFNLCSKIKIYKSVMNVFVFLDVFSQLLTHET